MYIKFAGLVGQGLILATNQGWPHIKKRLSGIVFWWDNTEDREGVLTWQSS